MGTAGFHCATLLFCRNCCQTLLKSYFLKFWNCNIWISRARFRSSDLWVMGPVRFRCATLLFCRNCCQTLLKSYFLKCLNYNIWISRARFRYSDLWVTGPRRFHYATLHLCRNCCQTVVKKLFLAILKLLAERGFHFRTSGLWAQQASTAPLCCSAEIVVKRC